MRSTPWLTAAELARLLAIPVGTVYRWAHETNARRTEDGRRPVLYDTDAMLAHARSLRSED